MHISNYIPYLYDKYEDSVDLNQPYKNQLKVSLGINPITVLWRVAQYTGYSIPVCEYLVTYQHGYTTLLVSCMILLYRMFSVKERFLKYRQNQKSRRNQKRKQL